MFEQSKNYIYDLTFVDNLPTFVKPKLIFRVYKRFIGLTYEVQGLTKTNNTDNIYTHTVSTHQKLFFYDINELKEEQKIIISRLSVYEKEYISEYIEKILFETIIAENKEWFKKVLPNFYSNMITKYSKG